MMAKGKLFIISSPSGGGKGTLIQALLERNLNISYSVSYTTRAKRDGEENGKDYWFIGSSEFESLIAHGDLLEFAIVHGNYYGTSRKAVNELLNSGHDVILEIDVQGAEIVKKKAPDATGIFILPPSYEVLEKRLRERLTENEESLRTRLNNARKEVRQVDLFDFVVVNDEIGKAVDEMQTIFAAERLTRDRQMETIRDILKSFES